MSNTLFTPITIGAHTLNNRVLMAPLTRNRADDDGVPSELSVEYYRQRASAGLIISEATQISPTGKGYIRTPGLHSADQVAQWRKITNAVHNEGGKIFVQLWHVGRISHKSLLPDEQAPVAPSAIRANAQTFTHDGFQDVSAPRALETDEISALIDDYRNAAHHAIEAGFDGVEVHSANGYLLDQFIHAATNTRTDEYGGNAENRARLTLEVTQAVAEIVGADRVGVRLSPTGAFNDMQSRDPLSEFTLVVDGLNEMGLAYLHMVEKFPGADVSDADIQALASLRNRWSGTYIANGDFDAERATGWIARGRADAIAFGRPFIANPDLPKRFELGADLNEPDQDTFYAGEDKGYVDYPMLKSA